MYHARSLFLITLHLYIPFHVSGTAVSLISTPDVGERTSKSTYGITCPDGLPSRVTRIQTRTASRPGIYLTDCSPARNGKLADFNPWDQTRLNKRQEEICSADCSNSCSDGTGGPSTNDCSILANQLSDRNSQFTVGPLQTVHQESETCMFSLVNMVSSSFVYCDSTWARQSRGLIGSCSSGGMCQGSRFQAVVRVNTSSPTPTSTPALATTPSSDPRTTNQGGDGDINSNNGGNSRASTGESESSSVGNRGSSSAGGNGPNSNGGVGGPMTTLSNGSVLMVPTGSVTLPSDGDSNGVSISTGEKNGSSTNVLVIVGAVFGLLVLFALIALLLLWGRKKRAQGKLEAFEEMIETYPRDSYVLRDTKEPMSRGAIAEERSPVADRGPPPPWSPNVHGQ